MRTAPGRLRDEKPDEPISIHSPDSLPETINALSPRLPGGRVAMEHVVDPGGGSSLWFPDSSSERAGGEAVEVASGLGPEGDEGDLQAHTGSASGRILVQWKPGVEASSRAAVHGHLGGVVIRTIHTLPMRQAGEGVLEVVAPAPGSGSTPHALLRAYRMRSEVNDAEPDQPLDLQVASNDPQASSLWGMQTLGYGTKAEALWQRGLTGSSRVIIGVVDTGIDYTHPDLYLNIWLNQGEIGGLPFLSGLKDVDADGRFTFRDLNDPLNRQNSSLRIADWNGNSYIDAGDLLDNRSGWEDGLDADGNGYIDDLVGWNFYSNTNNPYDGNSHGTHVAGTIGAIGNNGTGVVGVNWNVQLIPLKFFSDTGQGSTSGAVQAIDYFTGVKLLAQQRQEAGAYLGTNNSWGGGAFSSVVSSAIARAEAQDILFFAAAGNGGSDGVGDNIDNYPFYPASYSSSTIISVASIDATGARSSFSNYGAASVDLAAPGSGILSTVPGGYGTKSGTSMATPHVAGAAALLQSAFPQATAQQIRQALLEGVAPTPSVQNTTVSGGRLDIVAALDRLATLVGPVPPDPNPLPLLRLAASDSSAAEGGADPGTFTFTRSGTSTSELTITYAVSGTASGNDYGPSLSGSLTFAAGEASAVLTITPVDDQEMEPSETLILSLLPGTDYQIQAGYGAATITIADNDIRDRVLWGTKGNDIITGGAGNDTLSGVLPLGSLKSDLGAGQQDILIGNAGRDIFVLGDSRGVHYDDGVASNPGRNDYALIRDFKAGEDKLQLRTGRYFTLLANGSTSLYWDRNNDGRFRTSGSSPDELIATLEGVSSLGSSDYVWA